MAERDERIDAKIAGAAPFARPILEHLRELVHRAVPEVEEAIKWGMPHFTYKGKNIAGMAAFKAHCGFVLHNEEAREDGDRSGMGQFGRIASLTDLPPDEELIARLQQAKARVDNQAGKVKRAPAAKPVRHTEEPEDFTTALSRAPPAEAFWATLAPSHRREYCEWITEAKRAETRQRRISQAVEWLAEGKRRNWKYE